VRYTHESDKGKVACLLPKKDPNIIAFGFWLLELACRELILMLSRVCNPPN
jgi:hypothetical protein